MPLLLLDSDIEQNDAARAEVTDRLYGGGPTTGSSKSFCSVWAAYGRSVLTAGSTGAAAPAVFHTNEGPRRIPGHGANPGVHEHRSGFRYRLAASRRDRFHHSYAGSGRHRPVSPRAHRSPVRRLPDDLPLDRVLALGAEDYEGGDPEKFNMAVMGFRLSQRANGVSSLHGVVSREMFQGLWRSFDTSEVPITQITNGVHHLTWVHRALLDLLEAPSGSPSESDGYDWDALTNVQSKTIWALKRRMREALIAMTRERLAASSANRGMPTDWTAKRSQSRCSDVRLRSPRPVLQAIDLHVARSGSVEGTAHRQGATDPDRHRGQSASGRRGGQGAGSAGGAVCRRPGGSRSTSFSFPTTTSQWPSGYIPAATYG